MSANCFYFIGGLKAETIAASLPRSILEREYDRVVSLHSLNILETKADPYLDEIVRVAAHDLGMPIAGLNLIDAEREWTKSAYGYPSGVSIPREQAFCSHVVLAPDGLTVVTDASTDPRFKSNPLVTGSLGIRFYAGAPLTDAEGRVIGALSVMDTRPGDLDLGQSGRLCTLASMASARIASLSPAAALRESEEHYRNAVNLSPHIPWTALPNGSIEEAGPRWQDLTGMPMASALGDGWMAALHPDDLQCATAHWRASLQSGDPVDVEYRLRTCSGGYRWFRARAAAQRHWNGSIVRWFGILEDIHDRKCANTALLESEQRLRSALEVGCLGAWEYDADDERVTASDLCARAFGLQHGEDLSDYGVVQSALHPDDRAVLDRERAAVLSGDYQMDLELRAIWADGSLHWVRLTGRAAIEAHGQSRKVFGLAQDVTEKRLVEEERERSEARLLHLSNHDALTDLPNRQYLDARLVQALTALPDGLRVALICIDLDDFKIINQNLGNEAGDDLLRQLAHRLRGCSLPTHTIARTGGDEFAILIGEIDAEAEVVSFVQQVLSVIAAPFAFEGGMATLGASIGVSVAPDDGMRAEQLRSNAYTALLLAKTNGRGSYRFFEREMDLRFQARKALRAGFHDALHCRQLRLFYQPLMDLATNRIATFEALMRWQHPVRGLISPEEFIPLAEETGWIRRFGRWALREACREATHWPDGIRVAVNLSVIQFMSGDLQDHVTEALEESGLEASRLELEVTESLLLQDSKTNLAILEKLRCIGVKLVMDDFGTGYSSLAYLRYFRFDKIKIDKSLITGLPDADGGDAIVDAIFALGSSLGIEVTAEGIENSAQLRSLRRNNCTQAQGYFFSPAVSSEGLPDLLSRNWAIKF